MLQVSFHNGSRLHYQESEREAMQLQDQVGQARAESQELRAALQEASSRNQEHETLVADMTHVLQQQKNHIQVIWPQ